MLRPVWVGPPTARLITAALPGLDILRRSTAPCNTPHHCVALHSECCSICSIHTAGAAGTAQEQVGLAEAPGRTDGTLPAAPSCRQPMKFQTSSVSTRLAKAKSAKARSREMAIVPDVDGSSCSRRHTAAYKAVSA